MEKKLEENYQQNVYLSDNNNENLNNSEKNIKYKLKMKIINKKNDENEIKKIKNLYYSAFPKNELINFDIFFSNNTFKGKKIFAFYDKTIFVGFAIITSKLKISNILYLAIESELRGKGYGTQVLKNISNFYQNNRIVVDVEDPDKTEINKEQRLKRIKFYLNAGFKLTNIKYFWENEYYIIMVSNGDITEMEFWNFWKNR